MYLANLLILLSALYFAAGIIFAAGFVLKGVHRVDPLTRRSGAAFRLLLLPGSALLWPVLLKRWLQPAVPQ